MPLGHRVLYLGSVASTNEEALRLAAQGEAGGLWVVAEAQAKGRGRGGRGWSSPPGNLYASHLLRLDCPLMTAQQLTLLAPVALFDAVAALLGHPAQSSGKLRLKWPNDLLVGGAKVSGILLESAHGAGWRPRARHGFWTESRLASARPRSGRDASCTNKAVRRRRCRLSSRSPRPLAFGLKRWDEGRGFAAIRAAWLERAGPIGETLERADVARSSRAACRRHVCRPGCRRSVASQPC